MTNDDPKLTAYALNELEQADRAEVEAYLAKNSAARAVVEEIRRTVALLTAGLQVVNVPVLTSPQREAIVATGASPKSIVCATPPRRPRTWARWALATAACAAIASAGFWRILHRPESNAPVVVIVDHEKISRVSDPPASRPNVFDLRLTDSLEPDLNLIFKNQDSYLSSILENAGAGDINKSPLDLSSGTRWIESTTLEAGLKQNLPKGAQAQLLYGGTRTFHHAGQTIDLPDAAQIMANEYWDRTLAGSPVQAGNGLTSDHYAGGEIGSVRGFKFGSVNALQDSVGFTSSPTTGVPGSIGATGSGSSGGYRQIQSTVFTLPINRETYVTSNQPAGQKNIPYVDRFNNASNATVIKGVANGQPQSYADGRNASGQLLSRGDLDALVAHYRLRGADGVHLLDGGVVGYTQAQFEEDAKTGNFPPQVIAAMQRQLEHTATAPNESYAAIHDNPFLPAAEQPLSTFSIDVDTGSYSNIRRFLNDGQFPPPDAVRIEEMLNYFPYNYETPKPDSKEPFATTIEIAGCPWNSAHRLARVAIKGREIAHDKRPVSNLVFLIDVSGSMNEPAKLPLVKEGLKLMVNELTENDRISIVVYAGNAGLVLPSTTADPKNRHAILNAIDNLSAGGSTNGGEGIQLAYKIATDNFIKGGTNRVLLATDGDWNVGITDQSSLTQLIQDKAKSGVFLSVLGYGFGNLKDATMEKLADKGNGHYAYIDNLKESKKVLVEEMSSTLVTIAKDVKIQVEFNPSKVESYRLIGYEKRLLRKEDFNNDKVDAGEIGAGHCVTALYEITPVSRDPKGSVPHPAIQPDDVDSLKYQKHEVVKSDDLMTLKLRYKQPDGDKSAKLEFPAIDKGLAYSKASEDFKFSAAVAQFGMILRSSPYKGTASLDGVLELADEGKGKDEKGYRGEFLEMVRKAKSLMK